MPSTDLAEPSSRQRRTVSFRADGEAEVLVYTEDSVPECSAEFAWAPEDEGPPRGALAHSSRVDHLEFPAELFGTQETPSSASRFQRSLREAPSPPSIGKVRKINPKVVAPGRTAVRTPRTLSSTGALRYGAKQDEDISLKFAFESLMDRLGQLEQRLDKWNVDQQRRLEQELKGRFMFARGSCASADDAQTVIRLPSGQGKPVELRDGAPFCSGSFEQTQYVFSVAPFLRAGGFGEKSEDFDGPASPLKPGQAERKHKDYFTSGKPLESVGVEEDEPQPEREESPISEQEDERERDEEEIRPEKPRESAPARAAQEKQVAREHSKGKLRGASQEPSEKLPPSILTPIMAHPAFDCFFAAVIVLNSLFIGMQTHYRVLNMFVTDEPIFFALGERIFAALFFVELVIRAIVLKCSFFSKSHVIWNMFDLMLVLMSGFELLLPVLASADDDPTGGGGSIGKIIRMCRMVRIIRIMRVLRFLAELRVMVTLIVHSVTSLFWLLVLLLLILYVFSIFFTQGVTDYLQVASPNAEAKEILMLYYGGLGDSALTLFLSITGGISWVEVVRPLFDTGWMFVALFLVYVFFCVFSVLNIVTGVFVDGAIQRSARERDLRLEKEMEQKKVYVKMLSELLEEIDTEGSGFISREQLHEAFQTESVQVSFSVLGIDIADSNYLFDMLDLDSSGEVDMSEFITGCLRLKGLAKSIDIHTLMVDVKRMMRKLDAVMGVNMAELDAQQKAARGELTMSQIRQRISLWEANL